MLTRWIVMLNILDWKLRFLSILVLYIFFGSFSTRSTTLSPLGSLFIIPVLWWFWYLKNNRSFRFKILNEWTFNDETFSSIINRKVPRQFQKQHLEYFFNFFLSIVLINIPMSIRFFSFSITYHMKL